MKKLINGIVDFRKSLTEENRKLFADLALGQRPDALFIACSDSRVVPNLFASTNPGDVFVIRNVGNLIPPADSIHQDSSVGAALEFSIFSLNIANIIVCGHSECGAMQAIAEGISPCCTPHLRSWLLHGKESGEKVKNGFTLNRELSEHNQISQMNVLQQIEHIKSYPFIQERIEKKELRIHGWWFDIARADVYSYEEVVSNFVLIDEEEAKVILERLAGQLVHA